MFVIPRFSGHEFHDPCIQLLTNERIEKARVAGDVDERETRLLFDLANEGSRGLCAELEGRLAGYAWLQSSGRYHFGQGGSIELPDRCVVMKNLFVRPEFRGMALASKLNRARLSWIGPEQIPVVFIVPENRYAIRNWEQLGFERVAEVGRWRWLHRPWRMKIRRINVFPEAESILRAFEDAKDL